MKHKIKWLMAMQCEHHYITTNMTNKKNETVHLVEQRLTWEWIQEWSRDRMKDCSLDWLGERRHRVVFCSAWLLCIWPEQLRHAPLSSWLGTSFSCGTSGPFHVLHAPWALCCTSSWTLSDGLGCSVWSCQQVLSIYHTQLPSYSVPPRGGWQLF